MFDKAKKDLLKKISDLDTHFHEDINNLNQDLKKNVKGLFGAMQALAGTIGEDMDKVEARLVALEAKNGRVTKTKKTKKNAKSK